jgi:cytosine/adenosine deaminase-related metal-dependent hydrolase
MLLNNVMPVNGFGPVKISIAGATIKSIGEGNILSEPNDLSIQFTNAIAFPGLINSHDHLDFNCFSPLGNRNYNSYTEWGQHIHAAYKEEINLVMKIPLELRIAWGVYKNLLSGVTTVVNHGAVLPTDQSMISIIQHPQSLHSVKFEKNWRWKLNNPAHRNRLCVIHTGEGLDKPSHEEIDELLKYNLLNRKLVGIHGVAMGAYQAKKFEGLVWCPESNNVLLSRNANIARLKMATRVVFGTDSTLTGNWDIWQHLRLARSMEQASDEELFEMVTHSAANLWGLNRGRLTAGKEADIVIAKTPGGNSSWNDFFAIKPEDILMIVHQGRISMFDETMLPQLSDLHVTLYKFSKVLLNGTVKFVAGDLPAIIEMIKAYNPAINFPAEVFETAEKMQQ